MKRFCDDRQVVKEHTLRNALISLLIFAVVFAMFYSGVNSLSVKTEREQQKSLENAIWRGITHCYAVEGQYPESLEYLKTEYGIQYDTDKYFIDYQTFGSNLMPDVTIIPR